MNTLNVLLFGLPLPPRIVGLQFLHFVGSIALIAGHLKCPTLLRELVDGDLSSFLQALGIVEHVAHAAKASGVAPGIFHPFNRILEMHGIVNEDASPFNVLGGGFNLLYVGGKI
jgi:hypothetical protein